jgi:hypothetical protein
MIARSQISHLSKHPPMDPLQILQALNERGRLPVEAIREARAKREVIVPLVLQEIDELIATGSTGIGEDALFLAFHLLGEWRETAAYRPLANLLRLPNDALESVLGDAKTVTAHRVMAAVFDGDTAPLHAIIREEAADEFIRSGMLHTLVMLTLSGAVPRAETTAFLRDCYDRLQPREGCFVWDGWQYAVAWLGLVELKPLVQKAFARGWIDRSWLSFRDFEEDLNHTIAHPDAPPLGRDSELTPFGDTIAELEHWACFQPESARDDESDVFDSDDLESDDLSAGWLPNDLPKRNPFRHVGRNDPCPCGSGKKFKKCCLGKDEDELIARVDARSSVPTAGARLHPEQDKPVSHDHLARGAGITRYDPLTPPDPEQWSALEEQEQIDLVADYHRHARLRAPNAEVHAVIHVVVERQIALGDETPVGRTVQRLMSEGLDRHEAIHAVGSVLAEYMHDLVRRGELKADEDPNTAYYAALATLTAEEWLRSG